MSERVRGALFNALGDIAGLTLLDAFAGSGALSFESLSRGAEAAVAIDIDKRAHTAIVDNAKLLGLGAEIKAIRANASGWSDNNLSSQFDIVLAAPPYDNLQLGVVQKLVRHVAPAGLLVLDWPGKLSAPELPGMTILDQKNYGDAQLVFYRHIQ